MLNKVVLMGRLTADPELRRTGSDRSVTSFSLAVDRSYAKKGEKRECDFIDCVAWGATAEFICSWFNKGQPLAGVGRLQVRPWEDKQGNKRRSTEVVLEEAFFAGPKPESQEGGNSNYSKGGYGGRDQQKSPAQSYAGADAPPFDLGSDGGDEYSDLDIDDAELPY